VTDPAPDPVFVKGKSMGLLLAIGEKIQYLRGRKGITQEELEEKAGINAKYISAIERGQKNITVLNPCGCPRCRLCENL
jgi:transcriptional regulator with XRE-family HTH domain